jgi:hypothetical protein
VLTGGTAALITHGPRRRGTVTQPSR